jgi:hypothetical protein
MAKALDWTTRLNHEAQLHDDKCFVTLTFSDEHLPADRSIRPRDLQLWIKRLRKQLGHNRVRYFACGEYGEKGLRPHYHALLFGYCPRDLKPWRTTPSGYLVYRSAELEKTWPFGHVEIGTVTDESANYVARYVLKKVNGNDAGEHYTRERIDQDGVITATWQVLPEFIVMSTRPGIGKAWYDQFAADCFPSDFVIVNGQKRPVPRYYKKQLLGDDALLVSMDREARALRHQDNNTPERLAVREEVQTLKAKRLVRPMED